MLRYATKEQVKSQPLRFLLNLFKPFKATKTTNKYL